MPLIVFLNAANYAIEKALENKEGADNLTWGEYVKRSAAKKKSYLINAKH